MTQNSLWQKHKSNLLFLIVYGAALLIATYIFYRRFPSNFSNPNFYAEDGFIFVENIVDKGFLGALGTTFNGYYIWGIYLLTKLGFVLNSLLYGNEFVHLAKSLALVSYGFLGFVATLPLLLFRRYLNPMAIILACLLGIFVPILGYEYAVVGTIGNLKFLLIYVAFLLLIYRHLLPANSRMFYIVDVSLLICAYTNITVYAMLPFALVRYLPFLKNKKSIKSLWRNHSFISLCVLGLLLLPQLYVIKKYGVPTLTGYLDGPFNYDRLIEIFVSRSYFYGVVFTFLRSLNDIIVIIFGLLFLGIGFIFSRKSRLILLFGIYTVFVASFLFVIKRTGVSDLFFGYKEGGPDQFFYAQNMVFGFVLSVVIVGLLERVRRLPIRLLAYVVLLSFIVFYLAPKASTYGSSNVIAKKVGNVYANAQASCRKPGNALAISVYPASELKYPGLERQRLCTESVRAYYPKEVSLGLEPFNNSYVDGLGSKNKLTQTFESPHNNLDGLTIYFSTFGQSVNSRYSLVIYDQSCRQVIRKSYLNNNAVKDNSFTLIRFNPLDKSANTDYCFTVVADQETNQSPLAMQLSKPNIYNDGAAILNDKPLTEDVVFELHYR